MPSAELTITLSGTITLREFADQMRHFQDLVSALGGEVTRGQRLRWVISELDGGSASASTVAEVETPDIADRIEGTYLQVAEAMQAPDRLTLELPDTITKPARAIVQALDGDIKEVRFEAHGQVVDIVSPAHRLERSPRIGAYGSLLGRVESLSSHKRYRFTLYEAIRGQPIRCYFGADLVERVRAAWERHAEVVGWVMRDPASGRPIEIQRVRDVTILDEGEAPDFRQAIGAIPWKEGMPTAKDAIRQARDG